MKEIIKVKGRASVFELERRYNPPTLDFFKDEIKTELLEHIPLNEYGRITESVTKVDDSYEVVYEWQPIWR